MWPHFVNLLSRSWTDLLRALGTTTLAVVLFSILVPGVLWFSSVLRKWRATRRRTPPTKLREAFSESVRSALMTVGITVGVWIVVFGCVVVRRTYNDHMFAVAEIAQLQQTPKPPCPICPTCLTPSTYVEPKNSLRRRTMRLVRELNEFWSRRPTPTQVPVSNPSTEDDRQRNAGWDRYWRDAKVEYLNRDYKERLVGIVREYKSKGVDTGNMELIFDQPDRLVGAAPFGGWQLDNCMQYMNELCQLRELAYHVQPNDDPIYLGADSKQK